MDVSSLYIGFRVRQIGGPSRNAVKYSPYHLQTGMTLVFPTLSGTRGRQCSDIPVSRSHVMRSHCGTRSAGPHDPCFIRIGPWNTT